MRFLVITHVEHVTNGTDILAYGPYVREMNLWFRHVDEVRVIGPMRGTSLPGPIDERYHHDNLRYDHVPGFHVTSIAGCVKTVLVLPIILLRMISAMLWADHIHLRCPGNMGLIGLLLQVLLPGKWKTVKYAGNWDPASRQPLTYRVQKWIAGNTLLSRRTKVLVYGEWPRQSRNVRAFFTASYPDSASHQESCGRSREQLRLVFCGTLTPGKNPSLALEILAALRSSGLSCRLDYYGDGPHRGLLQNQIRELQFESIVQIHGNQSATTVAQAYKTSHYLILLSNSEGWPKAVAEAMFWGCVPVASPVSCVPQMLDGGSRGILAENPISASRQIRFVSSASDRWTVMSQRAMEWSRQYTLDRFEVEISRMLQDG